MVSPGCQMCSTPCAVWGAEFFGPCPTQPLPSPRAPHHGLRHTWYQITAGSQEGNGAVGEARSCARNAPASLLCLASPGSECGLCAFHPLAAIERLSSFHPVFLLSDILFWLLCPLPSEFSSQQTRGPSPLSHTLQL